jgi:hypothetical protein
MNTGDDTGGTLTQTGIGTSLMRTIPLALLDPSRTDYEGSIGDRSQHLHQLRSPFRFEHQFN